MNFKKQLLKLVFNFISIFANNFMTNCKNIFAFTLISASLKEAYSNVLCLSFSLSLFLSLSLYRCLHTHITYLHTHPHTHLMQMFAAKTARSQIVSRCQSGMNSERLECRSSSILSLQGIHKWRHHDHLDGFCSSQPNRKSFQARIKNRLSHFRLQIETHLNRNFFEDQVTLNI